MTKRIRIPKPLKAVWIAVSILISALFAGLCVLGILFFSQLWIFSEEDSTVQFHKGQYQILASAADAQQYNLYDSEAERRLENVQGYARQGRKAYVFNGEKLAVIDEKSGLIEIRPLTEADEGQRAILQKAKPVPPRAAP